MSEGQLARAIGEAPVTFVVGKGGVGKTTVAGALAYDLAGVNDCHLISTDPAHSLADLFDLVPPFPDRLCDRPLSLEEHDARAFALAWQARIAAELNALIEAGTYLDAEDAQRFLDLTFPGIDEVTAAVRLGELAAAGRRVVVDTAPTGHTLRLLDASLVLRSWTAALEAMSAKAGAVAEALVGTSEMVPGARLIAELRLAADRFDEDVLRHAAAVVVTRAEPIVEAETEHLIAALHHRGVRVPCVVSVGASTAPDRFAVEALLTVRWLDPTPQGCEGIVAWLDALSYATNQATSAPVDRASSPEYEARPVSHATRWILSRTPRILLVAGKGGVGKSTCAAALALCLARDRNVLLVSTDPAGSLDAVLAHPIGERRSRITDRLEAWQIGAEASLATVRAEYEAEANELFDRVGLGGTNRLDLRVIESLWNLAPPGIDEIAALSAMLETAGEADTIVIDSSPTGHFLRLIAMPSLALDWVHALMRVLVKFRAAGTLDALGERVLALARQLKRLQALLTDPREAGVFVVTMDEPLIDAETKRLLAAIDAARVPLAAIVANRLRDPERTGAARREDVPGIRIPTVVPPPVGVDRLAHFTDEWDLVE